MFKKAMNIDALSNTKGNTDGVLSSALILIYKNMHNSFEHLNSYKETHVKLKPYMNSLNSNTIYIICNIFEDKVLFVPSILWKIVGEKHTHARNFFK